MDTIYEVEWLIDIGAGVLVLPPHTIWFPVFISILMECLRESQIDQNKILMII